MTSPLEGLLPVTGPWRDRNLLAMALTHRSYARESPSPIEHNDRLEFIGDAVVGLVVGAELYRLRPADPVGDLAKLRARVVSEECLAAAARACHLGDYLRVGRGLREHADEPLDSLLADAFEALLGAVYCDGGFDRARDLTLQLLGPTIARALAGELAADYKSLLNNHAQKEFGALPHYRHATSGPPAPGAEYEVTVFIGARELGAGRGRTKRAAEQDAARAACGELKIS